MRGESGVLWPLHADKVYLLCSHMSRADDAFLDRADIKQYIGPPSPQAIFAILRSCALELMRVGLLEQAVRLWPSHVEILRGRGGHDLI